MGAQAPRKCDCADAAVVATEDGEGELRPAVGLRLDAVDDARALSRAR